MANLWTDTSNNSLLRELVEKVTVLIPLPVDPTATISLISGSLPPGLKITGITLTGTPYEVARITEYKFVLRATVGTVITDRTFRITVNGPDLPTWSTLAGQLAVGNNNTFFILDSSPIDFQLVATDDDLAAGQTLEYYISSGDGELPPGCTLTSDGRIIGIVDPLLAIERGEIYSSGFYDTSPYDITSGGFDFGIRSSNGFDSFYYDTATWDFNYTERAPNKLNRYYQFTVNVTDGDAVSRRTFKIFVVGDDFFRADNTLLQVGSGTFTADNTNLRTPIWITPGDLGIKRANNYITLQLDIIDTNTQVGFITYSVAETNPGTYKLKTTGEIVTNGYYEITGRLPKFIDSGRGPDSFIGNTPNPITADEWEVVVPETASILPPGVAIDLSNGEIAGRVPYQSKVTSTYIFTLIATRITPDNVTESVSSLKTFTLRLLGEVNSETKWVTLSDLGKLNTNSISVLRVEATTTVPNSQVLYSLASGNLPPGLALTFDGEIAGKVNSFGEKKYKSLWRGSRTYVSGDVVKHNGTLYTTKSNHLSTSSGIFSTDISLWEEFNFSKTGLTIFNSDNILFDANITRIDRKFKFIVNAEDQYKYSIAKQEFSITVSDPEIIKYSNISMKPFLKTDIKQTFRNFISDPEIFIPENIYRPGDKNFGIQRDVRVPVYYGIQSAEIQNFVAAAAKNHKRSQYIVGDLQTAEAKLEGTNTVVYEVIYLDVIDPRDSKTSKRTNKSITITNNKKITVDSVNYNPKDMFYDYDVKPSFSISTRKGPLVVTLDEDFTVSTRDDGSFDLQWANGLVIDGRTEDNLLKILEGDVKNTKMRPAYENTIKVDTDAINVSATSDNVRYISNLNNMRDNIRTVGATNRQFVPLWMRSQQSNSVNELGFTPSIVLCYCKPGTSAIIKAAINASNFNFKIFNLDMDRYIIDGTDNTSQEQYILFANYRFNI
jgi:hypothetical protein|tara:strand:- start:2381 stop:5221 length:2841 start_codon:yes stop_codon:yes gene_type:complete